MAAESLNQEEKELEARLSALKPSAPRPELWTAIESHLTSEENATEVSDKIIRPHFFGTLRGQWTAVAAILTALGMVAAVTFFNRADPDLQSNPSIVETPDPIGTPRKTLVNPNAVLPAGKTPTLEEQERKLQEQEAEKRGLRP